MTGNDVLSAALALIAEDQDNAGDYRETALILLNLMMPELHELNNNMRIAGGLSEREEILSLGDMTGDIDLDERIVREILPFGLAAKLVLDDDLTKASYFNNEFIEKKSTLARTSVVSITDAWGKEE